MSVNYSLPVISNRLQQGVNALDAGGLPGALYLLDGSGTVLSTLPLARPSAAVSGNTMAFNGLSLVDPAAAASGVAVAARMADSAGNVVISGLTVGTAAGSDIVLSPTNAIVAGQTIAIQAATITGT